MVSLNINVTDWIKHVDNTINNYNNTEHNN